MGIMRFKGMIMGYRVSLLEVFRLSLDGDESIKARYLRGL